jgi:hypothetical protein
MAGAVAATAPAATPPAQAQGIFGAIFGALSGQPPSSRSNPPAYIPRNYDGRHGAPDYQRGERQSGETAFGSGAVCVRMCDGRSFPLPRGLGGQLSPAKVCNALCPNAQTQVFNGSNLEYAVSSNGTRYADLNTAFAFRERIVPDCSCTGRGPGGLAHIDIESDPTLRAGDIVVQASGATIFKGSGHYPYNTADFTPIGDYGRINGELRRKLTDMKVDPTAQSGIPAQKLGEAEEPETPKSKPRRQRVISNAPPPSTGPFDAFFR